MNGMCLGCHSGGTRIYWSGSAHERQELACSDCHNPMTEQSPRGLLAKQRVSQTCFSCHPEQRAQFRKRSHMPLPEGKIACSDCHAPHGSSTDPLLRADSVNQLCYQCHAEKRGPFLWEHAPVVESCLNCHHPHGSNHEGLLVSPAPFLCNQCHDQPGGVRPSERSAHARQPRVRRTSRRADHKPRLRELPCPDPRLEPPVGCAVSSVSAAARALAIGAPRFAMSVRTLLGALSIGALLLVSPTGARADSAPG